MLFWKYKLEAYYVKQIIQTLFAYRHSLLLYHTETKVIECSICVLFSRVNFCYLLRQDTLRDGSISATTRCSKALQVIGRLSKQVSFCHLTSQRGYRNINNSKAISFCRNISNIGAMTQTNYTKAQYSVTRTAEISKCQTNRTIYILQVYIYRLFVGLGYVHVCSLVLIICNFISMFK